MGLGCILPDAFSPTAFWENNINGHTALRPLDSHNSWNWKNFVSSNRDETDKTYTITAGAIRNYQFDWKKFRIPPSEVNGSNPMQFMILDAGTQALEQVKVLPKHRTGIYIGSTGSGWQKDTCLQIHKDAIMQALRTSPSVQALAMEWQEKLIRSIETRMDDSLQSGANENMIVHSLASIACGRIAQYFDIRGPHVSIDAGYASSLAALEAGSHALQEGSIDLALIGGASEILTPLNMIAFAKIGGLSGSMLRAFDAQADGTLLGEGTAMFALKRLEDAKRDGEKIYAVLKGIGHSSDGRGKSLVAPDDRGQALAMQRAYDDSRVDPTTISYIECHATGTQVGDVSEVKALSRFHQSGASYEIALGSAKANVGHLGAAAGATGLLRAVLTLYHRTIPPQIHFVSPNPLMKLSETPFIIPHKSMALYPQNGADLPRAAISSFGFGGTNYHAVLEAYTSREDSQQDVTALSPYENEPIAIIGMAGMFPDAEDAEMFWENLLAGKDSITTIPAERFAIELYFDECKTNTKKTYTKKGGFLSSLESDSFQWKIPPSSAVYVDDSHYLALQCAARALQDASYDPDTWNREATSVIVGFLAYQNKKLRADARVNYQEVESIMAEVLQEWGDSIPADIGRAILEESSQRFFAKLPEVTEDTLPGYLGSLTAGRISKHFDFQGAQYATDGACCSAHLAFLLGVQSLRHKTSDVVLVGGINADMAPEFYIGGCGIQALSADTIRPFDAHADGFVPGEGGGFFVLRRLSDAQMDGQRILAVIRSVASTSDGKSGSILAPSLEGEASAMEQALQQAGLSPEQVEYVECHGTGTAMGDAIEIEAMTRAYGRERKKPLRIGSVKSNIGHLLAGSAVPAMMKTIFALREGVIPPSLHIKVQNPIIAQTNGNIRVVTANEQWETTDGQPRRAGVSGFGLGGANSHIIVEEYVPNPTHETQDVLPIAAIQGESLEICAQRLVTLAEEMANVTIEGYFQTLQRWQESVHQQGREGYRIAVVADHPRELLRKSKLLASAIAKGIQPDFLRQQGVFAAKVDPKLKVAVVFPGQGVQYANMVKEAMGRFPIVASFMQRVDEEYQALCGKSLTDTFFTKSPEAFQQTDEDIHCAVFAVNCAIFTLLRAYGFQFDTAIGQSAGELAALVAVEAMSLRDALKAMRERTNSVLSLDQKDPGQMMTVYCSAEEVRTYFRSVHGYCEVSADNSPGMCIVSGETTTLRQLRDILDRDLIQSEVLTVSHGYHSMMIEGARPSYRRVLDRCTFSPPKHGIISTITGEELGNMPLHKYPALLESQFVEPVRLRQAIGKAYQQGVRLFVECGPKWAVSSYISETLKGNEFWTQASLHPKIGEKEQLYRALACLFVHGKAELYPQLADEERNEMNVKQEKNQETTAGEQATLLFLKSLRDMIDAFLHSRMSERVEEPIQAQIKEWGAQLDKAVWSANEEAPSQQEPVTIVQSEQPVKEQHAQSKSEAEIREEVTELILSLMVQRTGYPKDMLELDLDLEADLGIDTVKQVAILADARHHYGLEQESGFRVRDYHTLRRVIDYFAARVQGVHTVGKQNVFFR